MAFFPNDRPSASFLQLIVITKQHQNQNTMTEKMWSATAGLNFAQNALHNSVLKLFGQSNCKFKDTISSSMTPTKQP
jgi:hypothetical protein